MGSFEQVKRILLFVYIVSVAFVSCQDVVEQNDTKTLDLQDPNVDGTVKSALENGSVSEVVVRKDLLLFPVNAPNLVIAHRQEIHAIPQNNDTNKTVDGKPTAAEVAEVNEYSLSQLVSTNDTDNNNETENESNPISAPSFPNYPQNDSVLEPGKLLEIVSGFNLSDGLATEKVPLPDQVQNINIPKQSIVDLLSKSLQEPNDTSLTSDSINNLVKRSVEDDNDSVSVEDNGNASNSSKIAERSIDSEESDEDDSDSDSKEDGTSNTTSTSTTEGDSSSTSSTEGDSSSTSTTESDVSSSTTSNIVKRFAEDDDDDDSSSSSTEYYDHVVDVTPKKQIKNSTDDITHDDEAMTGLSSDKERLRDDSADDMDVAEDIVFRPLFRYRQETRLKQDYKRPRYNNYGSDYGNQYRHKSDNSDYD